MNVTGWFWANCSDLRTSLPWFPSVFGIRTDISIISGILWQPMVYLLVRNVPPSQQHLPINLQLGEHPNVYLPVNLPTARPLQQLLQYPSYPLKEDFGSPEQGGSYRLRVAVDLILKGRVSAAERIFWSEESRRFEAKAIWHSLLGGATVGTVAHSQSRDAGCRKGIQYADSRTRWLSSLPDGRSTKGKGKTSIQGLRNRPNCLWKRGWMLSNEMLINWRRQSERERKRKREEAGGLNI